MINIGKILNIGDVHGRTEWSIPTFGGMERFYKWQDDTSKDTPYPFNNFDKVIFIGDYVDSFNKSNLEILHNLKNIIVFKKAYPDKVILIIGNHDVQYMSGNPDKRCTGFRPEAYYDLNILFNENIDLFQVAYQERWWLWTHGGLTKTFMNECVLTMKDERYRFHNETKDMSLVELLNFMFIANNSDLYKVGASSQGSSLYPSVLWARPEDLDNDPIGLNQIVGHTNYENIRIFESSTQIEFYENTGKQYENIKHVYIDCLQNRKCYILKLKNENNIC